MGSGKALLLLTGLSPLPLQLYFLSATTIPSVSPLQLLRFTHHNSHLKLRTWSSKSTKSDNGSSLPPPDVPRLAETARISLTPQEAEEFAPKIRQVIDCKFGQLQAVDLDSVEPALRADTEGDNLRGDVPETFEKREAIISGIPSYEEPYIKVPQVLNKEQLF